MLSELKSFMSPELLGRIDEVIVFNDLTLSDMENITRLEISALEKGSPNLAVHSSVSQMSTLLSQSRHFQKVALHERYAT